MLKGIDISYANGNINFDALKDNVDFLMIRAGRGKKIDDYFERNAQNATASGIPFGLYWFSYATSVTEAEAEADRVIEAAKKYRITMPIAYDFEYGSDTFIQNMGKSVSNETRRKMASAFLSRVENAGYYAVIYSNVDYIKRIFSPLLSRWGLWLADWRYGQAPDKSAKYQYKIWQTTDNAHVPGISGKCDYNICSPGLLSACMRLADMREGITPAGYVSKATQTYMTRRAEQYYNAAIDVICGKYGNGEARKKALLAAGFDPEFVQTIVNIMILK